MTIRILTAEPCCILSGIDQAGQVTVRTDRGHVLRIPVAALSATRGYDEIRAAADAAPQPPRPMVGRPAGLRLITHVPSRP